MLSIICIQNYFPTSMEDSRIICLHCPRLSHCPCRQSTQQLNLQPLDSNNLLFHHSSVSQHHRHALDHFTSKTDSASCLLIPIPIHRAVFKLDKTSTPSLHCPQSTGLFGLLSFPSPQSPLGQSSAQKPAGMCQEAQGASGPPSQGPCRAVGRVHATGPQGHPFVKNW